MLRLQVGDQIAELTLPISRLPLVIRVEQRIVRRLVAGDVEPDEPALRAALLLGKQRAPPGEMPLVEVHQPA